MRFYEVKRDTGDVFYRSHISARVDVGVPAHDDYEIFRVSDGNVSCTIEDREYTLSRGDVVFISPSERRSVSPLGENPCLRQIVRIDRVYLSQIFPDAAAALNDKPNGAMNFIPAGITRKYGIDGIFEQLHGYALSERRGAETALRLYAVMLAAKIGEILRYEYSSGELQIKKNVKKITDYIAENLGEPINLDSIANHLYLDKSYLCRLFKRETGVTINAYINMTRIDLAKRLIADGESPRGAYRQCGYNDYSTFYRAFRRCEGISPDAFRRGFEDN